MGTETGQVFEFEFFGFSDAFGGGHTGLDFGESHGEAGYRLDDVKGVEQERHEGGYFDGSVADAPGADAKHGDEGELDAAAGHDSDGGGDPYGADCVAVGFLGFVGDAGDFAVFGPA